MTTARAVLLIGSAKPSGKSTSEALASYLAARLEESGATTTLLWVNRSRRAAEDARIAAAVANADLFIVVTPLYVDSLPYLLTRTFEVLADARASAPPRRCAFAALVNCGFPEARHCQTALAIMQQFARRAGFVWAGGLALGEGGAIDGRRLADLGGMGRNLRTGLDVAAAALARGEPVPKEAAVRLAKPMMPVSVYTFMGNRGWKRQAARNGVRLQLADRPYE